MASRVSSALASAAEAVVTCQGLEKLQEAVAALHIRERYNVALGEVPEAPDTAEAAAKWLGASSDATYDVKMRMQSQWGVHRAARNNVSAARVRSPFGVYEYWKGMLHLHPELATLALRQIARPTSSASVERVFSTLTQIDTAERQLMQVDTLRNTLFLRANAHVVTELAATAAAQDVVLDSRAPRRAADVDARATAAVHAALRVAEHAHAVEQAVLMEDEPAHGGAGRSDSDDIRWSSHDEADYGWRYDGGSDSASDSDSDSSSDSNSDSGSEP